MAHRRPKRDGGLIKTMFRQNWQRWAVAIVVFAISAVYQRMTGPTYPIHGKVNFAGETVSYRLERTHGGTDDHRVTLDGTRPSVSGVLSYKRFKTNEGWTEVPMQREGTALAASLPHQPPAGKLQYRIQLHAGDQTTTIPPGDPVVMRFKGAVPTFFMATHILFMSLAMIFSNRAGLEALSRHSRPRPFVLWTIISLFAGGLLLGPVVQKYAFGNWWTGVPFGHDLTDNKTAIAFVFWLAAFLAGRKGRRARGWVVLAAVVMLGVYLIPHSVLGSELDFSKM